MLIIEYFPLFAIILRFNLTLTEMSAEKVAFEQVHIITHPQ